jgi:mannose-1-phosphate guanylyltransferase
MILAAGLGTRMQPLSDRYPKPALPVLDEPLLARHVRLLAAQGVDRVVVNAHAQPDQIRRALADAPIPVEVSVEPELCGSGGGILHARALLEGNGPFLVLNADMCIELDLGAALDAHRRQESLVTLVLRDDSRKREFGSIGYAPSGQVSRITDLIDSGDEQGSGLFVGVHVIEPELFSHMPNRSCFQVLTDVYLPMLEAGVPIGTWLQPASAAWWPVGTPAELLEANLLALDQCPEPITRAGSARIEGRVDGPVFLGEGAVVAAGAVLGPRAVLGAGSELAAGAVASDTLLLPGSRLPAGARVQHGIVYGEEVWGDA